VQAPVLRERELRRRGWSYEDGEWQQPS